MPSGRTTLTEVATALGCMELPNLDWAILRRPGVQGVATSDWDRMDAELASTASRTVAEAAFSNGQHFHSHPDGLRLRCPQIVEWTGGRKPPGDQSVPADLRIDHVYLVSCKYLSRILLNTAPARLFDALLRPGSVTDAADWFDAIAPSEHRTFARLAAIQMGLSSVSVGGTLDASSRAALKEAFGRHARLTGELPHAYENLCRAVSSRSAERWRASIVDAGRRAAELLLWRMLRLTSATYFVLGVGPAGASLRLRVMTPWDWRQSFELRALDIEAAVAGQPQVTWTATVRDRGAAAERIVEGHVEIRWSHGRFAGPPEAKVYLDTPHADVPGYVPLD